MYKRGLVLGGGGTKGSYQLGAWEGFRELDLSFDLIVGTSIGALNGALMVAGDYEAACLLWEQIESDQVFPAGSDKRIEALQRLATPVDLLRFAAQDTLVQGSFSSEKLQHLIREAVDEQQVRSSPVDFGLVTVEFPSLQPYMPFKDEIPQGELDQWLMASAACFPVFTPCEIGGARYIDGGYYDNLPVGLAVDRGACSIVSVDLDGIGMQRPIDETAIPDWIRIEPRWDLGSIFDFDRQIFARNRALGYLDTLKAFGRREGHAYTFFPGECNRNAARLSAGMLELVRRLRAPGEAAMMRAVSLLSQDSALRTLAGGNWEEESPLLLCRAAELAGMVFELDPGKCYRFEEFNLLLRREYQKVPRFFAVSSDPQALIAALASTVEPPAITLLISQLLSRNGGPLLSSAFSLFPPREYVAACYLLLLLQCYPDSP